MRSAFQPSLRELTPAEYTIDRLSRKAFASHLRSSPQRTALKWALQGIILYGDSWATARRRYQRVLADASSGRSL